MMFAQTHQGKRAFACPNLPAVCPGCAAPVIPKCGELKVWHWAHRSGHDCDPWSESESAWHLGWKARFPPDRTEVYLPPHRADIVAPNGRVLELQHSPIAPHVIREREAFYRRLVWIVDAAPFIDHLTFTSRGTYHTFRWKWPRSSWLTARQPVFLDIGDGRLFAVKNIYPSGPDRRPCAGWGFFLTVQDFIKREGMTP
jgi:competence protein CoiA